MSLSDQIIDNITNMVKIYISRISTKYSLNEDELFQIWDNKNVTHKPTTSSDSILDPELMKLNKKELAEICRSKNVPVSGTKMDLIKRILNTENKSVQSKKNDKNSSSSQPEIIKKLLDKIPVIEIKRNSHGNYEHANTRFVINNSTKKVFGKQNDDGTISELTKDDIDQCHKYKFAYDIPENLDKKIDIEENENEEDDELDEELEEELLEELDDDLDDLVDDIEDDDDAIDDTEEYYDEE